MAMPGARLTRRRGSRGHIGADLGTMTESFTARPPPPRRVPSLPSRPSSITPRPDSALSTISLSSTSGVARSAAPDTRNNFLVAVRVRPALDRELSVRGASRCVSVYAEQNSITLRKPSARPKTLDVGDFGERLQSAQPSTDVHSFAYDRLFDIE